MVSISEKLIYENIHAKSSLKKGLIIRSLHVVYLLASRTREEMKTRFYIMKRCRSNRTKLKVVSFVACSFFLHFYYVINDRLKNYLFALTNMIRQ